MSEETSTIAAKKLNYGSSKNVDDEKTLPPVDNFEEALSVSGGFGLFAHVWDSHKPAAQYSSSTSLPPPNPSQLCTSINCSSYSASKWPSFNTPAAQHSCPMLHFYQIFCVTKKPTIHREQQFYCITVQNHRPHSTMNNSVTHTKRSNVNV